MGAAVRVGNLSTRRDLQIAERRYTAAVEAQNMFIEAFFNLKGRKLIKQFQYFKNVKRQANSQFTKTFANLVLKSILQKFETYQNEVVLFQQNVARRQIEFLILRGNHG